MTIIISSSTSYSTISSITISTTIILVSTIIVISGIIISSGGSNSIMHYHPDRPASSSTRTGWC